MIRSTYNANRALRYLALGDCNTHTADASQGTIPRGLVRALEAAGENVETTNLGGGMETCREGLARLMHSAGVADLATINYGLVDAWQTCVPFLYVPYYPDSFIRKRIRKALKFTKRRLFRSTVRQWLPRGSVVSESEYCDRIEQMIALLRERNSDVRIFVWGSVLVGNSPQRNESLVIYNALLRDLSHRLQVSYIDSESLLEALPVAQRHLDGVHLTPRAAEIISQAMCDQLQSHDRIRAA